MRTNTTKNNKGFTLIELMIATVIFMMIMITAIGALVSTSNASKKSKALRSAMDNVNYAMDSMSRNLRLGSNYYCGSVSFPVTQVLDCSGGDELAFIPAEHVDADTYFRLNLGAIEKCEQNKTPQCIGLTAPEVEITDLVFYVRGTDSSDGVQPSILILVKGKVVINGEATSFSLQNLVSQRNAE